MADVTFNGSISAAAGRAFLQSLNPANKNAIDGLTVDQVNTTTLSDDAGNTVTVQSDQLDALKTFLQNPQVFDEYAKEDYERSVKEQLATPILVDPTTGTGELALPVGIIIPNTVIGKDKVAGFETKIEGSGEDRKITAQVADASKIDSSKNSVKTTIEYKGIKVEDEYNFTVSVQDLSTLTVNLDENHAGKETLPEKFTLTDTAIKTHNESDSPYKLEVKEEDGKKVVYVSLKDGKDAPKEAKDIILEGSINNIKLKQKLTATPQKAEGSNPDDNNKKGSNMWFGIVGAIATLIGLGGAAYASQDNEKGVWAWLAAIGGIAGGGLLAWWLKKTDGNSNTNSQDSSNS